MSRPYYIFQNGRIMRRENTVCIENEDGVKKAIPIEDIEIIHIFGEVDCNTKFLNFLSQMNVPIFFYNYYGYYSGVFMPREKNVSGFLLVKQVEHYTAEEKRIKLAIAFIDSAMFHMQRNLRAYKGTEKYIDAIQSEQSKLFAVGSISELMGCEGRARDIYYQSFNEFLHKDFFFEKREKRPPTNPINALISFGNSLIYNLVLSEIYRTPLNPTVSYLHQPSEKRFSLSLDIAEIFKPLISDPIIFNLINNRILAIDDFERDLNFCYLKEEGRKKFIKQFDEKIGTTIKHRTLKRKVSYRSLIRYECYKIVKHLLGEQEYKPLKAWW